MKIKITQTLKNGHVKQKVLTTKVIHPLQMSVDPGTKIDVDVFLDAPEQGAVKRLKKGIFKKIGFDFVLEYEGQTLLEIQDFYVTPHASVGAVNWHRLQESALAEVSEKPPTAYQADASKTPWAEETRAVQPSPRPDAQTILTTGHVDAGSPQESHTMVSVPSTNSVAPILPAHNVEFAGADAWLSITAQSTGGVAIGQELKSADVEKVNKAMGKAFNIVDASGQGLDIAYTSWPASATWLAVPAPATLSTPPGKTKFCNA